MKLTMTWALCTCSPTDADEEEQVYMAIAGFAMLAQQSLCCAGRWASVSESLLRVTPSQCGW